MIDVHAINTLAGYTSVLDDRHSEITHLSTLANRRLTKALELDNSFTVGPANNHRDHARDYLRRVTTLMRQQRNRLTDMANEFDIVVEGLS